MTSVKVNKGPEIDVDRGPPAVVWRRYPHADAASAVLSILLTLAYFANR
jgi:hypothetical protein